jgi:hypothetical protein
MCAVRTGKRIVHERVAQTRHCFGKLGVACFFLGMKA